MRYSASAYDLIKARGIVLLACVLVLAGAARANDIDKRKAFAQKLTEDIVRSGLRKIYVPDFTDRSGQPVVLGQYFAATFSALLSDNARGFAVVNRVDAHRYLSKSAQTDHDLSTTDILAKFLSNFGPDAILSGSISVTESAATIDFVAREASGKELFRSQYEEKLNPILREDSESSQPDAGSYFVGLDGVTPPRCLYCPIPAYPIGQGHPRLEGDVVLSVLVTIEGKPEQIRLIQALGPDLDRAALEGVRTWRFEAAKNSDDKFVPVRLPVQITFKMHWQIR